MLVSFGNVLPPLPPTHDFPPGLQGVRHGLSTWEPSPGVEPAASVTHGEHSDHWTNGRLYTEAKARSGSGLEVACTCAPQMVGHSVHANTKFMPQVLTNGNGGGVRVTVGADVRRTRESQGGPEPPPPGGSSGEAGAGRARPYARVGRGGARDEAVPQPQFQPPGGQTFVGFDLA